MSFKTNKNQRALWYTVGPSSLDKTQEMLLAGATGVRLTFSYGTPELQFERAVFIKQEALRIGKSCYIVADLAGEKLRLGTFEGQSTVAIKKDQKVRFIPRTSTNPTPKMPIFPIPPNAFVKFLSQIQLQTILTVGDGSITFSVEEFNTREIVATALADGSIEQNRGLILQEKSFNPDSLTSKDLTDLEHILSFSEYDAVAISFVNSAEPIKYVRDVASTLKREINIIAKIETSAGIERIEEICDEADLIMAARGDLALTTPWIELPGSMNRISNACREKKKPWIVATQLAEGLERFLIPTRAEICDLAHWCEEGCSGAMLSHETVFGQRPVLAIKCVREILDRW